MLKFDEISYKSNVSRFFNKTSFEYDKSTEWKEDKFIYESFNVNPNNAPMTIIDIATGTGLCGQYFKKNGNIVYGVDLAMDMLVKARDRIDFPILADAHNLPFDGKFFDLAIMRQCLHYLDIEISLNEAYRIIKDDGILISACAYWPNLATEKMWQDFKGKTQPLRNKVITENFLLIEMRKAGFFVTKKIFNKVKIKNTHILSKDNTYEIPIGGWEKYMMNFVKEMKDTSPEMNPEINNGVFSYTQHWITIHAKKIL